MLLKKLKNNTVLLKKLRHTTFKWLVPKSQRKSVVVPGLECLQPALCSRVLLKLEQTLETCGMHSGEGIILHSYMSRPILSPERWPGMVKIQILTNQHLFFPSLPFLSLFLNNHLLNYTVLSVSFVTFLFFFCFDYLVFINTIHPSIPKAKEKNARCLLVCFARVLGWSKGGLWFQVQADKKGGIRPCLPLPTSQKCSENEMRETLWSYPMRVFMTALVMPCKHHHYYYTTL